VRGGLFGCYDEEINSNVGNFSAEECLTPNIPLNCCESIGPTVGNFFLLTLAASLAFPCTQHGVSRWNAGASLSLPLYMHSKSLYQCVVFISVFLAGPWCSASNASDKLPLDADKTYEQAFSEGLKLQDDTASAVAKGAEKTDAAISRIKALDSPSGLRMADRNGDFAVAAIGIGERLRGLGKNTDAFTFFAEAEKALVLVIAKVPDSSAQEKAMFLHNLAFIRGYHLGQASQAKKDFDAAIKLKPDDVSLRRSRGNFLNEHAELAASDRDQPTK
jgi:hypothetical protein